MADFKWADVGHYYGNSGIQILSFRGKEKVGKLIGICATDLQVLFGECEESSKQKVIHIGISDGWHKPILRHRDDMTEVEIFEYCKHVSPPCYYKGDPYPIPYSSDLAGQYIYRGEFGIEVRVPWFQHITEGEFLRFPIFNKCCIMAFVKLIEWGFDVFGLIKSGQAIRKETKADNRIESHC